MSRLEVCGTLRLTAPYLRVKIDRVMTDLLILGTLLGGPKHGYRLKQEAGLMFGEGDIHNNLVYPLLRRFSAKGWISRKTAPGERGQKRQIYALTALGRRALMERITQFGEHETRSTEQFIIRVGFFELLTPEARSRILNGREQYLRRRDDHLSKIQNRMEVGLFGPEVLRHVRERISAELKWIHRLRRKAITIKAKE